MLLHGFTSYFCICLLILRSFPIGPGEMSLPVFVYITVIGGGLLSCCFFFLLLQRKRNLHQHQVAMRLVSKGVGTVKESPYSYLEYINY